MAVVEREIKADGSGDYTTIAAWETATDLNGGADVWKGVISDNSSYNESITISTNGTSVNSYVWLTVASANRHSGVWDTGKARLSYTGSATAAIEMDGDWSRVDWLQIERTNVGSSDEGIRINADSDTLIDYCIIRGEVGSTTNDTDGIYAGAGTKERLRVSNSIIYGWTRGCIHSQQTADGTGDFHTFDIDHCSLGLAGEVNNEGNLNLDQQGNNASNPTVVTIYNSWIAGRNPTGGAGADIRVDPESSNDIIDLEGSHNAYRTVAENGSGTFNENIAGAGTPNFQQVSTDDLVDTAPATAGIYITESDHATFDATPVDHANNVLIGNGTDKQGSEPDARQDFSIDATGGARPTTNVDIGAIQVSAGAGGIDRTVTDALGLVDTTVVTELEAATANDTSALTDTVEAAADYAREITDDLGLTDDLDGSSGLGEDNDLGLTDDVTVEVDHGRTLADNLGLTDDVSTELAADVDVSDGQGLTDDVSVSMDHGRSITDPLGLVDTTSVEEAGGSTIGDGSSLTDDVTAVSDFNRTITDPLGLVDEASSGESSSESATDTAGLTDDLTVAFDADRTLTDVAGLVDTVSIGSGQTISDDVGLTDNLLVGVDYVVTITDNLGATDSVAAVEEADGEATVTDPVGLVDSIEVGADYARDFTDSAGLTDDVTVLLGKADQVDDLVGLTDSLVVVVQYGVTIDDDLGGTDPIGQGGDVDTTVTDPLGLVDSVTVLASGQPQTGLVFTSTDQDALSFTNTSTEALEMQ